MSEDSILMVHVENTYCIPDEKDSSKHVYNGFFFHVRKFGEEKNTKFTAALRILHS